MSKNKGKEIVDTLLSLEESTNYKLPVETTIACRVDGVGFSEFTKDLIKPFDNDFQQVMENTMLEVTRLIQGCYYSYSQSDEITFLIRALRGQGNYYSNRIQKLASIIGSTTSVKFNKNFQNVILNYEKKLETQNEDEKKITIDRINLLKSTLSKEPIFDCRCFTVPECETYNLICYRQHNCTNNALQMMAHCYLDDVSKMKYKDVEQALNKTEHSFESLDDKYKLGVCCQKDENNKWIIKTADKFYYDKGCL